MSDQSERIVRAAEEAMGSQVAVDLDEHRDVAVAVVRQLAAEEKTFGVGTLLRLADEMADEIRDETTSTAPMPAEDGNASERPNAGQDEAVAEMLAIATADPQAAVDGIRAVMRSLVDANNRAEAAEAKLAKIDAALDAWDGFDGIVDDIRAIVEPEAAR